MKKIKMLIALAAMSLILVMSLTGCGIFLTAEMNIGDGMLSGYDGYYDALVFRYYGDDSMKIVNLTTGNPDFAAPITAAIPDYEEETAFGRQGNDIMSKVKRVTIEANVTGIGAYYFYQCTDLEEVYIGPDVDYIGENAFKDCNNIKTIVVDEANQYFEVKDGSLIEKSSGRLIRCTGSGDVVFGAEITSIEDCAFAGLTELTSVDLSATTIPEVSEKAFAFCESLTEVKLPATVATIDKSAFLKCGNLAGLDFKSLSSLKEINDYAFFRCNAITTLEMPENLTHIRVMAFANCEGLTTIVTNERNVSIGNNAFYDCPAITTVTFNNADTFGKVRNSSAQGYVAAASYRGTFGDVNRNITVYVKADVVASDSFANDLNFGTYFKEKKDVDAEGNVINTTPSVYVKGADTTINGITYATFTPAK